MFSGEGFFENILDSIKLRSMQKVYQQKFKYSVCEQHWTKKVLDRESNQTCDLPLVLSWVRNMFGSHASYCSNRLVKKHSHSPARCRQRSPEKYKSDMNRASHWFPSCLFWPILDTTQIWIVTRQICISENILRSRTQGCCHALPLHSSRLSS